MKLYLVRHGECTGNTKHRFSFPDDDLTEKGVFQAKELRGKMKNLSYDVIYSSPYQRTLHTAQIINYLDKEIIVDERLKERSHGSLEGELISSVDPDEYWNCNTNIQYGTEESISDLCSRVKDFLEKLKKKQYQNVLIVSHSGVSKAFHVYFEGIPKDGRLLSYGLDNTEIREYDL